MSKKIIITFDHEPTPGLGVSYTITLNGLALIYPNGENSLTYYYQPYHGTDPDKVEIKNNFSLTIDSTLAFLVANYSMPGLVYARVNDTIEVSVNIESAEILVYLSDINPKLSFSTTDLTEISTVNLRYYLEYRNIVNDVYLCEIFKKNYTGAPQEINGKIILEKANVTSLLDPIRGGGVSLQLEASKDLTLEDLYSESEQEFKVIVYKNNKIIFLGYLNPDGVYQDYVRDEWRITLDCVDGLGAISNLAFVQPNGLHFTGKMKAQDIIYQCLKRTGTLMNINTSVNILYDGLTDSDDVFRSIYLNADRFIKSDNDTIMSCEEILKSILDIFKACITQWDGEWYIFKPNEIYTESYVVFRRFDTTNNYIGNKKINLNKDLGSQIDNYYPHHCSGNQRIEIKGALGGFRLGYKYGLVSGLLPNPGLIKNVPNLDYDNWIITNVGGSMLNDPTKDHGFLFKNFIFDDNVIRAQSDPIAVTTNDDISLRISFNVDSKFGSSFVKMQIKVGSYYLKYSPKTYMTPIDDTKNATWETTPSYFTFYLQGKNGTFNVPFPAILADGALTVAILCCTSQGANSTTFIDSLDIVPTQSANNAIQGEFHTVERSDRVSTIVKPNQTVYNGDNVGVVYMGAIYDINQIPTKLWNRKNSLDKFPLLRIAAEEEMRIAQRPTKVFKGDIYGYIPYLSLIKINNVGSFMPVEWSYDTKSNVTSCKQLELFAPELNDLVYTYSLDYGQTVKPTIK